MSTCLVSSLAAMFVRNRQFVVAAEELPAGARLGLLTLVRIADVADDVLGIGEHFSIHHNGGNVRQRWGDVASVKHELVTLFALRTLEDQLGIHALLLGTRLHSGIVKVADALHAVH